jgi:hypothetical protein
VHLKVIACEVLAREVFHCAAEATNTVDIELYTQGLHDNAAICRGKLQPRIDAADPERYDAVVLGYGLCNNAIAGLAAGRTPLVIARAHDCITLFLGSKERYAQVFAERPGTYWYTSGWLEYAGRRGERVPYDPKSGLRSSDDFDHAKLVEQYGEENAEYLMSVLGNWAHNYTHGALVDFPFAQRLGLEERVRSICDEHGWDLLQVEGDLALIRRLIDGPWDEDAFLRVEPGQTIAAVSDDRILVAR